MTYAFIYLIIGCIICLYLNTFMNDESLCNDLVVQFFVYLFIIMMWPLFAILFIKSLYKFKNRKGDKK